MTSNSQINGIFYFNVQNTKVQLACESRTGKYNACKLILVTYSQHILCLVCMCCGPVQRQLLYYIHVHGLYYNHCIIDVECVETEYSPYIRHVHVDHTLHSLYNKQNRSIVN